MLEGFGWFLIGFGLGFGYGFGGSGLVLCLGVSVVGGACLGF